MPGSLSAHSPIVKQVDGHGLQAGAQIQRVLAPKIPFPPHARLPLGQEVSNLALEHRPCWNPCLPPWGFLGQRTKILVHIHSQDCEVLEGDRLHHHIHSVASAFFVQYPLLPPMRSNLPSRKEPVSGVFLEEINAKEFPIGCRAGALQVMGSERKPDWETF